MDVNVLPVCIVLKHKTDVTVFSVRITYTRYINDTPIEEHRVISTLLCKKCANVHYTTVTMSVSPSQAFSD